MNKKIFKYIGITAGSLFAVVYLFFLILPFIVSPILNNYIPQINEEIEKVSGLRTNIEGLSVVTTPKLTAGIKIDKFKILTPDNKEILYADKFQAKMSLLPLFAKRIEADLISLENLNLYLGLNKDGSFEIEKYLPAEKEENKDTQKSEDMKKNELPFGLKISNKLPDIRLGNYSITFKDLSASKDYVIKGEKFDITDFIMNKSVRINAKGNITLAGREQFNYDLKLLNKIMPEEDLHELIFNPQENTDKKKDANDAEINILEVFRGLYNYKITANAVSDLTIAKDSSNGYLKLDNLGISPNGIRIPASDASLVFKGSSINIDSNIYTAENEKSTLTGTVKTGSKPKIDINLKSGAELSNLVRIVNAIAVTFNIKDLQTLSANGKINADFNIKSDMKKVNSSGYLKIPAAKINYGLYKIIIDKINADISLDDNNVNIKNVGFSIFEQPLKLYGTIKEDASANLHLTADNLNLKGLIIACGQSALLKENQINSGLVSFKADIVGNLNKITPSAKIFLKNLDIKNIPADTIVKLPDTTVNIITNGTDFSGNAISKNVIAINPAARVSIPSLSANIKSDVIEIPSTPVIVEKINFNLSGKIKNYLSEKMILDFITTGDIKSKLTGDVNSVKQTLNLVYSTTENSAITVPGFDKSKMVFNSNLTITGNMANPQVSGTVDVPSLNLPEIPVTISNLNAKLHGDIVNGTATVAEFTSGGIAANKITTDFSMKGSDFYLNNMKGEAFNGKFKGDIVYNMANAKTKIDFKGEGMSAEKAIEGAAGIKKALSGTLSFDTKMNLTVYPDYNEMMKSLGGNLSFKIENGAFGTIGRLENFLHANNIIGNTLLKTTVNSLNNVASVKNSAVFDYITGDMTFLKGWANIANIKSTGKSIAYFVTGKYNLINGSADLVILGRLDGTLVKALGPLGELSAEKLLSYIPKLGELTAKFSNELTTDPDKERTKDIPELSGKPEIYKDFKVVFNGGVENASSVKSFKWLTKADTSAIEQQSIKESVKSLKKNLNTDVDTTVQSVKDTINAVKEQQEQLKDTVNELKNLFKF